YFVKTVKEDVAIGADSSHECYCSFFPQLKKLWQRKSPGIPGGKQINSSSPEASTSRGYHSPGDSATGVDREGPASSTLKDLGSQYQQLEVALDSSSTIIDQLSENINSLGRVQWGPLIPACQSWTPVSPWGPEERAAGPSEVEQLQEEANHLRKELESVGRRLQAEVENNKILTLLQARLEKCLRHQEKRIRQTEEEICELDNNLREWEERIWEEEERIRDWEARLREQEQRLRQWEERPRQQEEPPGQERPRELERVLEPGWEALDEECDEPSSASEEL
ncbi:golgin subfamily A member 6-like protein 9, partial [Hylobates moloch]|uniref:golgin subfamily A member 6-like protein 9 n=1 Tax=Hylobates moloch TaxID=81572 RepID=UPI00267683E3